MNAIGHIFRRATRSLWENLYLNAVATGVIAAALLLVGVFLTVEQNAARLVESWDRDAHLSAYFQTDIPEARRFAVRDRVAQDPRVASVRYVSEAEATAWFAEREEGMDGVLEALGPGTLPASLEISLTANATTPAAVQQVAADLAGPDFEVIDYGGDWVERFVAFLSLLQLLGAVLGSLILTAAIFLVFNTVHLVVYNRKDELEIQKLVGGTYGFILAPFLIEGLVQGVAGGTAALLSLQFVHSLVVVRLQEALSLGLAGELLPISGVWMGILLAAGMLVGLASAGLAVRRFLGQAP